MLDSTDMNISKFKREGVSGVRSQFLPQLNRSALGREIGVTRAHISRILSGQQAPSIETMRKLSKALDMTLDEVDKWLYRIRERAHEYTKTNGSKSNNN